jgi:16S rRNA (uracil1498-N3)-methyltransferase
MRPRFYVDLPLQVGAALALPPGPARHAQVLRLQPGSAITLFNGQGGEWSAAVTHMGRSEVSVQLGDHHSLSHLDGRELAIPVTLALGVPTNERMDSLVEKATELGVHTIQPLMCERSVLRLSGERAQKKVLHWQAVQSGRTKVPCIEAVRSLTTWLLESHQESIVRWVLSLADDAQSVRNMALKPHTGVTCLSGPEGGLTATEEQAARSAGFLAVSLGPRVLRADTAPLAVMADIAISVMSQMN